MSAKNLPQTVTVTVENCSFDFTGPWPLAYSVSADRRICVITTFTDDRIWVGGLDYNFHFTGPDRVTELAAWLRRNHYTFVTFCKNQKVMNNLLFGI